MEDKKLPSDQKKDQTKEESASQAPPKYWKIIFIVLLLILIAAVAVTFTGILPKKQVADGPLNMPIGGESSDPGHSREVPQGLVQVSGIVKTGAEIGSEKDYCSEGYYLVAEEGEFLFKNIAMLQLRTSTGLENDAPELYNDEIMLGRTVDVIGKYPAQEAFCEALLCECEDYILIEDIYDLLDTVEESGDYPSDPGYDVPPAVGADDNVVTLEGEVVCLSKGDGTGPTTLECAYGLQDEFGMQYGLSGVSDQEAPVGSVITVTGEIDHELESVYNTVGSIKVTSVQ